MTILLSRKTKRQFVVYDTNNDAFYCGGPAHKGFAFTTDINKASLFVNGQAALELMKAIDLITEHNDGMEFNIDGHDGFVVDLTVREVIVSLEG